MHAFSYTCSLPATKMAVTPLDPLYPKPQLHANITDVYLIERELLPIEVLHCGNIEFSTFLAFVILTLIR